MKNPKANFKNFLTHSFERFQKAPVPEAQSTWKQLLNRHRDGDPGVFERMDVAGIETPLRAQLFPRKQIWAAVAAVVLIAVALSVVFFPGTAMATVASVEGGLQRVTGAETQSLKVNDPIRMGEVIRSNGGSLVLADGSRIETRSGAELLLERAPDGVRIQLHNGGIIVDAARQREGHLHVQTRDFTVSVVGTVFLVNAETEGSRVAVIEGEVHVEQGRVETRLRSGEQVATNPSMKQLPVSQEIAWSRQAEAHMARLEQELEQLLQSVAAIPSSIAPPQRARPVADRWESISIQACGSRNTEAGVRGGAVGSSPGELRVTCMPLRYLLEMAYVKYLEPDAIIPRWFYPIAGGPSWVDDELFTIRARANGQQDHMTLGGPMLQTLLEDRFKLKMQREVIEEQVYELLDAGFKAKPVTEEECAAREVKIDAALSGITDPFERLRAATGTFPCGAQGIGGPSDGSPVPPGTRTVNVHGGSLDLLVRNLSLDRIVLDRTGIKGLFDMRVTYSVVTSPMREPKPLPPGVVPGGDSIFTAMEQQLGLRLLPVKGPRIYYTIQNIDRPALD